MAVSMSISYKNPPPLTDKNTYHTWKNELEIWRRVTELDKKKQALAVSLSLSGTARQTALEIPAEDLGKDDGMETLIAALDGVFLREKRDLCYEAYSKFDRYKRTTESMADYIIEFDQRYTASKKYEMTLPDPVLAFKLMDGANLDVKERQLALTASKELKYADMKSALKRIFGDDKKGADAIDLKPESACFTKQKWHNGPRQNKETFPKNPAGGGSPSSKKTNPLNRYGKPTKCAVCQSIFHWAKDCPDQQHRDQRETAAVKMTSEHGEHSFHDDETCNLTLFTKTQETSNQILLCEAFGCAVLDTACTRTVCGESWLENYMCSLTDKQIEKITSMPSKRTFRFGDGVQVKSAKTVKIPACIGGTKCNIDTEVVPADLPLLLSRQSMKRAGTLLNLKKDGAEMFGKQVQLQYTSSGHYCVDLGSGGATANGELESDKLKSYEVLVANDKLTEKERRKMLMKLHQQFGHASKERLQKLLENAGKRDPKLLEMLDDIVKNCDLCLKFKKPSPRPAVGLPLATEFNETVAVDLHEIGKNLWYLHIIDEFTRFSAGAIMRSKKSSVFTEKFIQHWISIYGAPRKLYSDNGGEFSNAEVRDMCENFNIEAKTTAAYSPWSNGLMERHNQTLTAILHKVHEQHKFSWETALSWALMAKNSLSNVHGYSAFQLVFGQNPNLPSVLTDRPPALEGTTSSKVVHEHIMSLFAARRAFTEAESSERIRRALRKQIRPVPRVYQNGDKVYYKRPDSMEWRGPGTVIGQDGAVVFVRHAGILVRVHQSRLRQTKESENENKPGNLQKITFNDVKDATEPGNAESDDEGTERGQDDRPEGGQDEEPEMGQDEGPERGQDEGPERGQDQQEQNEPAAQPERQEAARNQENVKLKTGQIVTYDHEESGEPVTAKVLGRAGRATGINKNWYNLEYQEPNDIQGVKQSVDLGLVKGLKTLENDQVLMLENVSLDPAKQAELDSWKRNSVYTEVIDKGQRSISTRWVCTLKQTENGFVQKARLVARGFEDIHQNSVQKDSPTCDKESFRLVLAVMAQNKWMPHSVDVKTAFLQGKEIDREVFIRPPKEAHAHGKLWRLQKCVYGLSDASLLWYQKVKSVMLSCGGQVSKVDPAVFYWKDKKGEVIGILACHVDDFIWGGSQQFAETAIKTIKSTFHFGKEESAAFKFIGMNLAATADNEILLDQHTYAEQLEPIYVEKQRAAQKHEKLSGEEKTNLRSKVGQIMWIACQTRPDVVFDACNLASSVNDATVEQLLEVNKLVKRIKGDSVTLRFQRLEGSLRLYVFTDASLGNLADGGTQGGYIILLAGENDVFSPIAWSSRKIRRVVRSTLAGETLAVADGIDEGIYLATLFAELTVGKPDTKLLPVTCVTDSRSLYEAVRSNKFVREKRLRIEISGIKELLQEEQFKLMWTDSKKQLADCLTKRGASPLALMQALEEGVLNF